VFHTYYLAVLGPPLAALAGIGASLLWQRWRDGTARWAVPLTLLVTAAWHAYIQLGEAAWRLDDSRGAMLALVLTLLAISGAGLQWSTWPRAGAQRAAGLATLALLAMLMLPLAWALSTVLVRPNVAAPAADIARLLDSGLGPAAEGPPEPAQPRSAKLLEFLRAHRQSERYLLAVPNALQAAPLIVRTGEPIMAMGGYLGRDPILTPSQLERMVNAGELRYAIVGGPSIAPPNKPGQRALAHWIRSHGRRVDPALWRESTDPNRPAALRAGTQRTPARLYDLRPEEAAQAPEGEEGP
jgi:4-amino-4-deoxy-L-arabinose transferase-like glycosyltransferase